MLGKKVVVKTKRKGGAAAAQSAIDDAMLFWKTRVTTGSLEIVTEMFTSIKKEPSYGTQEMMVNAVLSRDAPEIFHYVMGQLRKIGTVVKGPESDYIRPLMRSGGFRTIESIVERLDERNEWAVAVREVRRFMDWEMRISGVVADVFKRLLMWVMTFRDGVFLSVCDKLEGFLANRALIDTDGDKNTIPEIEDFVFVNLAVLQAKTDKMPNRFKQVLLELTACARDGVEKLVWGDVRFHPTDPSISIQAGLRGDKRHGVLGTMLERAFVYTRTVFGLGRGDIDTLGLLKTGDLGWLKMGQMNLWVVLLREGGGYIDYKNIAGTLVSETGLDDVRTYMVYVAKKMMAGCEHVPPSKQVVVKKLQPRVRKGQVRAAKAVKEKGPIPSLVNVVPRLLRQVGVRMAPTPKGGAGPAPAPASAPAPIQIESSSSSSSEEDNFMTADNAEGSTDSDDFDDVDE